MTRSDNGTLFGVGQIRVVCENLGRKSRGSANRPAFIYSVRSVIRSVNGRYVTDLSRGFAL